MHHLAVNRPWPDDGHLHHEVVPAARLQAREHAHLRPALDLEDPHAVGATEHVVGRSILGRHLMHRHRGSAARHHVECLANAREHAQGEHVDFEDPHGLDVILVPLDDAAAGHGRIAHRDQGAERFIAEDEAAHMLGQVPREADQRGGDRGQLRDAPVTGPEPRFLERGKDRGPVVAIAAMAHPAIDAARHAIDRIGREAHGLGDLAHRHAAAHADGLGAQCRALAAEAAVDVLDHFLAALVLEVDVDVGRLVALAAHEAFEQHVDACRIHRRDPQAPADGAVGGGAAPLAEDPARACEAHDVVDSQEERGVVEVLDQREFMFDQGAHTIGDAVGMPLGRPLPGAHAQPGHRRVAIGHEFSWGAVLDVSKIEPRAGRGDGLGAIERMRNACVQPLHLFRRTQEALGIRCQQRACTLERGAVADAAQHVVRHLAFDDVHVGRMGGHHRDPHVLGKHARLPPTVGVIALGRVRERKRDPAGGATCQVGQRLVERGRRHLHAAARHHDRVQAIEAAIEVMPVQSRRCGRWRHAGIGIMPRASDSVIGCIHAGCRAPVAARVPERDETAEVGVAGVIHAAEHQVDLLVASRDAQPAGDDRPDAGITCRDMRAHGAGERVAIGDRDGADAECASLLHQFLGLAGPFEETERADDIQRDRCAWMEHGTHVHAPSTHHEPSSCLTRASQA